MEESGSAGLIPAVPTIHVTHDVIGEIAAMAVLGVEGVSGVGGGIASGLNDMLGRRSPTRGVRVDVDGRQVTLSLHLIVDWGVRIPEVAQRAQEEVKREVERATGLLVQSVDIHIVAVSFSGSGGQTDSPGVER